MIRPRIGFKILGMCSMLAGVTAFSSGAAQAEIGASWMVNGANVTDTLLPTVQVGEIENKTGSLLVKISGASVTFLCTGAELIGAKLELNGSVASTVKAKVTGCITFLNGTLSGPCKPKSEGQPLGSIISNEGKGLSVLHEGKGLLKVEPKLAGGSFAVIRFDPEAECSLPEQIPVKGVITVRDSQGEEQVEKVSHLVEQGPLTHLFVISDTAEHAASIDGSATVGLGGAHSGLKFSGLPG